MGPGARAGSAPSDQVRQSGSRHAGARRAALIERTRHPAKGLEVHTHCIIGGPRARFAGAHITHSHAGGDVPHQHPDTGPACYTIDRDEWLRATGMKGGDRKKYTRQPTGEQMPLVDLEDWQKSFNVVVAAPPSNFTGTGGGFDAAARMILAFGMECSSVTPGNDRECAA